jgi:hypothetical protein
MIFAGELVRAILSADRCPECEERWQQDEPRLERCEPCAERQVRAVLGRLWFEVRHRGGSIPERDLDRLCRALDEQEAEAR